MPYQTNLPLRKYFTRFGGGLQTQEEPQKIGDDGSPDLLNVRPIGRGAYAPRNGIAMVGSENNGVGARSSIWNFSRLNLQTLISSYGTTLEYLKTSNNTWTTVPGIPTYTADQKFGFANDKKYVYFCNAVDDFAIWDGKHLSATFTADAGTDEITSNAHGLALNDIVVFTTTGTLPAGLSLATTYFVISVTTNTFMVSTTFSGSAVDITDTGSGTHTFTSSVKTYPSNPKGNIKEFYLNRLFVAGQPATPDLVSYSVINVLGANPSFDFSGSGSGSFTVGDKGDPITALRTFQSPTTGKKSLFIFKRSSQIYEMYFDDSGNRVLQEVKAGTGAVNHKSTINLENDIIYVDNGNNIANIGYRENLQNELRTDSTTTGLDRTTSLLTFDNPAAVYWKKRKMALYSGKSFGATNNDVVLAYFYDFKSWWRWTGINANEFAIYQDEIVWASSSDLNVFKYDETRFDDQDGSILSYRHSKDEEFNYDRSDATYADIYKKARFATFRGFISPGATMRVGVIYDANPDTSSIVSFVGTDEPITTENAAIYFGANVFGYQAFGGSALSPTAFPMREFFVVVSLDHYSHLRARLITEVQEAGAPYVITHQALWAERVDPEAWPSGIRI